MKKVKVKFNNFFVNLFSFVLGLLGLIFLNLPCLIIKMNASFIGVKSEEPITFYELLKNYEDVNYGKILLGIYIAGLAVLLVALILSFLKKIKLSNIFNIVSSFLLIAAGVMIFFLGNSYLGSAKFMGLEIKTVLGYGSILFSITLFVSALLQLYFLVKNYIK
ncbi:MAG: hypothetical protein ACTTID_04025 [Bacillales bacterium]